MLAAGRLSFSTGPARLPVSSWFSAAGSRNGLGQRQALRTGRGGAGGYHGSTDCRTLDQRLFYQRLSTSTVGCCLSTVVESRLLTEISVGQSVCLGERLSLAVAYVLCLCGVCAL